MMSRQWNAQTGCPKGLHPRPAGTAIRQAAVNDHGRNTADPQMTGAICDLGLSHVEDHDFAGWASRLPDEFNRLLAAGTASTKYFNSPFC
jgi:hypothetical protein